MILKRRKYFYNTLAMLQEISPACNKAVRPCKDLFRESSIVSREL
jgi:hypothetical protein